MILIGLLGRAGAGKDTVADLLQEEYRVWRFAFADQLKREVAQAWKVDVRLFADRALKEVSIPQLALRNCEDAGFFEYAWELGHFEALKPRTVMQRWGDYQRARNLDHYVQPATDARHLAVEYGYPLMVATDVRAENEAAWITWNGGQLWRIRRPGLEPVNSHWSEHALRDLEVDATIVNDGTVDELRRKVLDLAGGLLGETRTHRETR